MTVTNNIRIDLSKYELPFNQGATIRHNHEECPAGTDNKRRLYITHDITSINKYLGFCHNCGNKGYLASPSRMPQHVVPTSLIVASNSDKDIDYTLSDFDIAYVRDWGALSTLAISFLQEKLPFFLNLNEIDISSILSLFHIGYNASTGSIIYPILKGGHFQGTVAGNNGSVAKTVSRLLVTDTIDTDITSRNHRKPKYIVKEYAKTDPVYKMTIDPYEKIHTFIVEDYFSAISLLSQIEHARVYPLFGSSITINNIYNYIIPNQITERDNIVHVWLDNDSQHIKEKAREIHASLKNFNIKTSLVTYEKQASQCERPEILHVIGNF